MTPLQANSTYYMTDSTTEENRITFRYVRDAAVYLALFYYKDKTNDELVSRISAELISYLPLNPRPDYLAKVHEYTEVVKAVCDKEAYWLSRYESAVIQELIVSESPDIMNISPERIRIFASGLLSAYKKYMRIANFNLPLETEADAVRTGIIDQATNTTLSDPNAPTYEEVAEMLKDSEMTERKGGLLMLRGKIHGKVSA